MRAFWWLNISAIVELVFYFPRAHMDTLECSTNINTVIFRIHIYTTHMQVHAASCVSEVAARCGIGTKHSHVLVVAGNSTPSFQGPLPGHLVESGYWEGPVSFKWQLPDRLKICRFAQSNPAHVIRTGL